jgi:uncharacterized protein
MLDFKLISADSHIGEHPDAWVRAQREFGDRAPHVVLDPPGLQPGLWIIQQGLAPMRSAYFSMGYVVDKPGHRDNTIWSDPETFRTKAKEFRENFRYETNRGGWDPAEYIKAMDRDNVEATIIYSSATRFNYLQDDPVLQRGIFRSYNEWIIDTFAAHAPKRLFPAPLISVLDIDLAIRDIREYVKRGVKTVHIPTTIGGSGYWDPKYEPLWQTAVELGIPLSAHSGASQGRPVTAHGDGKRDYDPRKYIINGMNGPAYGPHPAWEMASNLIFSGVFDRYPTLKIGLAEFQVWDAASTVQVIDYDFGRVSADDPEKTVNKRWPSEYLRENVFFGFEDDRALMLASEVYGENNFMWGSDFPHHMTTWPRSLTTLDENTLHKPGLARKVGRENANNLYHLVEAAAPSSVGAR